MASASGVVLEGTPICVDRWKRTEGGRIYFLTHAHTDHTVGLTSRWCNGMLYCTEITASLIIRRLGVDPSRVVALEVGSAYSIPIDDRLGENGGITFTVTLFDANHCPGAVMYLFHGFFGTILCTGDFRYCPTLHDTLADHHVDRVYLDNTFLDETREFPSRETALKQVLNLMVKHPRHSIAIGLSNIGKEGVLAAVAKELGQPFHVTAERAASLRDCQMPAAMFEAKPNPLQHSGGGRHLVACSRAELALLTGATPWLKIVPSAWCKSKKAALSAPRRLDDSTYQVPYSDHCSNSELVAFVRMLRPAAITPIVRSANTAVHRLLEHHCRKSDGHTQPTPPSVARWMRTGGRPLADPAITLGASAGKSKRSWSFDSPPETPKRNRTGAVANVKAPTSPDGITLAVDGGHVAPTVSAWICEPSEPIDAATILPRPRSDAALIALCRDFFLSSQ